MCVPYTFPPQNRTRLIRNQNGFYIKHMIYLKKLNISHERIETLLSTLTTVNY